jgi:hypothetical protein
MATIRKRSGKYQVQVRKDGKNISRTFIKQSDAIKWSKEQEVKIEQGSYISKKETVTLSFLLSRWEQEVLINLNPSSSFLLCKLLIFSRHRFFLKKTL